MRRFAWTRILSVLLVLCMVASFVSMGIPTALAERVTIGSDTLEYFPVTLYNYDAGTINAATHQLEVNAGLGSEWKGMYFGDGAPAAESFTYTTTAGSHTDLTWAQVMSGTYYSNEACTTKVTVEAVTEAGGIEYDAVVNLTANRTNYNNSSNYSDYAEGGYYYNNNGNYEEITALSITRGGSTSNRTYAWNIITTEGTYTSSNGATITIYEQTTSQVPVGYKLMAGSEELAKLDGTNTSAKVGVTLYTAAGTTTTGTLPYAAHNWWNKNTGNNDNGQKTYTGLVASQLDANKDIVFNVPDAGIFNDDASVKDIYTNVQIPFLYAQDGNSYYYTFNAAVNGVYFHEDAGQGSSGTAASNTRLYFAKGDTQGWSGMNYGDGSTNLWAPFDEDDITGEGDVDYHFGMNATIPFTMTANGRINANNDSSDPINFIFSGDDDVWVFIDGQLVVDLGGIHNRLNVKIDFAANTVTYSEDNNSSAETGSYNDDEFALTQTLFGNLISQDRATFAATDNHELTIFYMERGGGSSNAQIKFNLPVKDNLVVTKQATNSWNPTTNVEEPLTDSEQAIVNNINFGFTLYKKEAGATTYSKVANTTYNLLNANGQVLSNPATDANGHFTLQNGQSARFVTEFAEEGVSYYVVEDDVSGLGFVTPDFAYSGTAHGTANQFVVDGTNYAKGSDIPEQELATDATENKSYEVTVFGSDADDDTLQIICKNFVNSTLPNPSALPADDKIVIDYGLSVVIDALSNDNYRGNKIEIIGVYGDGVTLTDAASATVRDNALSLAEVVKTTHAPQFGTAAIVNGKITYQLTKQLSGVEVLNYVVQVTGEEKANNYSEDTVVAYKYGVAKVYIIPATTMYYEENFGPEDSPLVTFSGSNWKDGLVTESEYTNTTQEPGVVGTVGDSPYGSDAAYLNDRHDSNGTSKYAETKDGAVKFTYSFTGTGTSFYARTSATTGYLKIAVYKGTDTTDINNLVHGSYRDTVYTDTNDVDAEGTSGVLYNIPVFTWNIDEGNMRDENDTLKYGTYTVVVTVAKYTEVTGKDGSQIVMYNKDFWLDGIRVYEPLNPELLYPAEGVTQPENYDIAASAYATDGEANMAVETLRDKLIGESDYDNNGKLIYTGGNFATFTDSNGNINNVEDYKSDGPKEEVYLNNGQSVTFSLTDWDPNTNKIYLGIKAPSGTGTVNIGGTVLNINNAADCFYDISDYAVISTEDDGTKTATFTITAGEGSLISVTTIKVSGNFEFTIFENLDISGDGPVIDGED